MLSVTFKDKHSFRKVTGVFFLVDFVHATARSIKQSKIIYLSVTPKPH